MLGVIGLKYIPKQREYADVKGSKSYFIFLRIKETRPPKSEQTTLQDTFHGEWQNLVIKSSWHRSHSLHLNPSFAVNQ